MLYNPPNKWDLLEVDVWLQFYVVILLLWRDHMWCTLTVTLVVSFKSFIVKEKFIEASIKIRKVKVPCTSMCVRVGYSYAINRVPLISAARTENIRKLSADNYGHGKLASYVRSRVVWHNRIPRWPLLQVWQYIKRWQCVTCTLDC